MNRRTRHSNPWKLILLVLLVGAAVYVNQVIVPVTSPLGIPTPTPTRSAESFVTDAQKLAGQGKFTQAIASYQSAIEADPKNVSNYIQVATLQIYNNAYKDAITNSENAILLNQNNSMAHALRGWALSFTGDYLNAEVEINQAIQLDQNNASAYAYLAEVIADETQAGQGGLGSLDKAITASKTAVQLNKDSLDTHWARGIVLDITGNHQEANSEYQAAVAINGNIPDLHLLLGESYSTLLQDDKAIEEFNKANVLNPTDPNPLLDISRTYFKVGDYAKAVQYALEAVKASPEDPYMYGNLGTIYYRVPNYPDAIAALRLAVRGGKASDGTDVKGLPLAAGRVTEYYYTFGLALARQGDCGEALQISQIIQQGASTDDVATYNAQEMVNICTQISEGTVTPQLTAGAGSGSGSGAVSNSTAAPVKSTPPAKSTPAAPAAAPTK